MDLEPWDPLIRPKVLIKRQESEDSDAEGGLGNVTRMVLRPPGHSGKAKKGHLCFDASYETGNLGRVDFISEFEYDLFIRPDTCNPRYRIWFNFIVDNVRSEQRVIFNLVNLSKSKLLFREGMSPVVKSTSRPKWHRIPSRHVFYHRSPEHHGHPVLSFAFGFDREEDIYQFAFSFPYSYSRVQAHLDTLQKSTPPHFRRESIAQSVQQRRMELLTIGPTPSTSSGQKPKVIVVMARSHPGESPTSFVCQGLIDFLVSQHPIAVTLREHVVFKIMPMLNPDGVFLGNHRCTLMGFDLNRTWHQTSQWGHPTLHAAKQVILDLNASKNMELDIVLDLHAHSSLTGAFIYGNAYDDVYRLERHVVFSKFMAQAAEDFSTTNCMYNKDPVKQGTARRFLCSSLRESVNCYTLEVSFHGYFSAATNSIVPYTEEGYLRLGRNIARATLDMYRALGVLPQSMPTQIGTVVSSARKPRKPRKVAPPRIQRKKMMQKDSLPSSSELPSADSDSSNSSDRPKEIQLTRRLPRRKRISGVAADTEASSDVSSPESGEELPRVTYQSKEDSPSPKPTLPLPPLPRPMTVRQPRRDAGKPSINNLDFPVVENPQTIPSRWPNPPPSSIHSSCFFPPAPSSSTSSGDTATEELLRGIGGIRSLSGKKVGGGGLVCSRVGGHWVASGPPPRQPLTPCLTVVDLNLLSRKGIALARGGPGTGGGARGGGGGGGTRGRGRVGRARGRGKGKGRGGKVRNKGSPVGGAGAGGGIKNVGGSQGGGSRNKSSSPVGRGPRAKPQQQRQRPQQKRRAKSLSPGNKKTK